MRVDLCRPAAEIVAEGLADLARLIDGVRQAALEPHHVAKAQVARAYLNDPGGLPAAVRGALESEAKTRGVRPAALAEEIARKAETASAMAFRSSAVKSSAEARIRKAQTKAEITAILNDVRAALEA